MSGSLVLLAATAVVAGLFFAAGGYRRLALWRESRDLSAAFERLTRATTLDYRWGNRIGISRSHLFLVGAFDLDGAEDEIGLLPPARYRLDMLEAISQKGADDGTGVLVVTVRSAPGKPLRIAMMLPDRRDLEAVYDAIHRHGMRSLKDKEKREFDALVAGATLDYRFDDIVGLDRDSLYTARFQAVSEDEKPGDFIPPARYRLRDLNEIAQAPDGNYFFLVLTLVESVVDGREREFKICHAFADRASLSKVYDEIRARIVAADPPTSANAPTPLAALLRTIASREIDARRFLRRLQSLDPEVDTAIWKLRECAEPEAVFMIDWNGEPGREERFTQLFAAWRRPVRFIDTEADDMAAFLSSVHNAAAELGMKLWMIDTRSDFYQGFLTPVALEDSVRDLCRQCEIKLYG